MATTALPIVTLMIIGITVLISYKGFNDRSFFEQFKHFPYSEARNKDYFRMLTSGFLHGSWAHLGLNMYVLFLFGGKVEQELLVNYGVIFGRVIYLAIYLTTIFVADIPTFLKHRENPGFGSIGASGGVSGILFASILFEPMTGIGIIFIPIYLPGFIFGILYLIYTSWAAKKGQDQIDHDAHLYGALYGILATLLFVPSAFPEFIRQVTDYIGSF